MVRTSTANTRWDRDLDIPDSLLIMEATRKSRAGRTCLNSRAGTLINSSLMDMVAHKGAPTLDPSNKGVLIVDPSRGIMVADNMVAIRTSNNIPDMEMDSRCSKVYIISNNNMAVIARSSPTCHTLIQHKALKIPYRHTICH